MLLGTRKSYSESTHTAYSEYTYTICRAFTIVIPTAGVTREIAKDTADLSITFF